jgi:hypothetical protein
MRGRTYIPLNVNKPHGISETIRTPEWGRKMTDAVNKTFKIVQNKMAEERSLPR